MSPAESDQGTGKPEPSAEQAADLAALESAVNEHGAEPAAGGTQAAPQEAQGPKPPTASAMAAAGLMVGLLRPFVLYVVPVLKDAPGELWEPVVPGVAGVLDHVGMGNEELFSNPWFALMLSVAPLGAYAVMNAPKDAKPATLEAPAAGPDLSAPVPAVQVGTREVIIGAPIT